MYPASASSHVPLRTVSTPAPQVSNPLPDVCNTLLLHASVPSAMTSSSCSALPSLLTSIKPMRPSASTRRSAASPSSSKSAIKPSYAGQVRLAASTGAAGPGSTGPGSTGLTSVVGTSVPGVVVVSGLTGASGSGVAGVVVSGLTVVGETAVVVSGVTWPLGATGATLVTGVTPDVPGGGIGGGCCPVKLGAALGAGPAPTQRAVEGSEHLSNTQFGSVVTQKPWY